MLDAIDFRSTPGRGAGDTTTLGVLWRLRGDGRRRLGRLLRGQASEEQIKYALAAATFFSPLLLVAYDELAPKGLGFCATAEDARAAARRHYRRAQPWIALNVSFGQFACWREQPLEDDLEYAVLNPHSRREPRS